MSQFLAIYGQRRRQVTVIVITGTFAAIACMFYAPFLPRYLDAQTAVDDGTLWISAQTPPIQGLPTNFMYAWSSDGSAFSAPSPRSGIVINVAACRGHFYCLLAEGAVSQLSKAADNWVYIPAKLDWHPVGLAAIDNAVTVFGQNKDRTKIVSAVLDNMTWKPGLSVDYPADNISYFVSARSKGSDYLLWTEAERTTGTSSGTKPATKPLDVPMVPHNLHVARVTRGGLEMLPATTFERPASFGAVGDESGIHVFYRFARGRTPDGLAYDPRIRTVTFAEGKWGPSAELKQDERPWIWTEDFAVASFGGKTFIYSFDYWFKVLYVGAYASEVRQGEVSKKFLAIAPSDDDLVLEVRWVLMAIVAAFITAGGLAGFLMLRRFPPVTPHDQPLYATVTDRGTAAVLDFFIIYSLVQLLMNESSVREFWPAVLVCYIIYGTMMESMSGGQTLGKKLLGLRVVSLDGAPVLFPTALRRNLFKFIEMLTVGLGACLVSRRFQRPGDFLAGTIVVKEFPILRESEE